MLAVLVGVVLPVALVAAVGGAVGRRFELDVATLSRAVFWLFSPALVYEGIAGIDRAGGEILRVVAVTAAVFAVNVLLAQVVFRLRGEDEHGVACATVTSGLANQGNLGLPVSTLAFGAAGLELGTLVWITNLVLANSLGVAAASFGRLRLWAALLSPLRYPSLHAALLGLVVNATGAVPPLAVRASVETLAGASIPCMLLVLGLQFHLPSRGELAGPVLVTANRLLVGPLVAWGAVAALGLGGVPARTAVVMAGMPTAVMSTVLTAELGARPAMAVRTVIVSTIAAVPTLTVLIWLVR